MSQGNASMIWRAAGRCGPRRIGNRSTRPHLRRDAPSGAPRSLRTADGRGRAACSGRRPDGQDGMLPTWSRLRTSPCSAILCVRNRACSLVLGSLEQMELDETGDLGQLGVAAQPHLLEGLFGARRVMSEVILAKKA